METITKTENPASLAVSDPVTAEQINQAFEQTLLALKSVAQATREFSMKCVVTGELLKAKKAEFPPRGGWLEWLEKNCPDISRNTADRLMKIADYCSGGNIMPPLPERISSVRDLHEALFPKEPEDKENGKPAEQPSRVVAALSRFWGAITRRPPNTWDEMERTEFLTDLAERERIRKENGWDLPVIDVEEVKP